METKDNIFDFIEDRMKHPVHLPHQAAAIGFDIFKLIYDFNLNDDPKARLLLTKFKELLSDSDLENLLDRQVNYAVRLAEFDGSLEYEEIHKLLSLCDDIHALEYIGLEFDNNLKQRYKKALRSRFVKDIKKVRLVAEDRVEDWNRGEWWYKENLLDG